VSKEQFTSRRDYEVAPKLREISLLGSPQVAVHELLDAVADRLRREDVAQASPPEIECVVRAPLRIGKPPERMPEVTRKVVDMLWGCEGDDHDLTA